MLEGLGAGQVGVGAGRASRGPQGCSLGAGELEKRLWGVAPAPSLLQLPPMPQSPEGEPPRAGLFPSKAWQTLIHTAV